MKTRICRILIRRARPRSGFKLMQESSIAKSQRILRSRFNHFVANPASGNVMRKAGMRHEGTLRGFYVKDGAYIDVELYAIVAREWRQTR